MKGFTLIELLIIVAIFAIALVASAPYLLGALEKQKVAREQDKIVDFIKEMQQESLLARDGLEHGVRIAPTSLQELPTGKQHSLPPNLEMDSNIDIYFKKLTGEPDTVHQIILTSEQYQTTIDIEASGLITKGVVTKF